MLLWNLDFSKHLEKQLGLNYRKVWKIRGKITVFPWQKSFNDLWRSLKICKTSLCGSLFNWGIFIITILKDHQLISCPDPQCSLKDLLWGSLKVFACIFEIFVGIYETFVKSSKILARSVKIFKGLLQKSSQIFDIFARSSRIFAQVLTDLSCRILTDLCRILAYLFHILTHLCQILTYIFTEPFCRVKLWPYYG